MKQFFSLILALVCCLSLNAAAETAAATTPEEQTACAVVEAIAAQDYSAAEEYFSEDLASALGEQALREADLTVITLQHRLFRENKASIAAVPHYDCVGLLHQA